MKRIALLGGTFDPIHNGHIHIAYEALYRLNLDEVIFLPNGNPPHKNKFSITNTDLRIRMIEESIREEALFSISRYEIDNTNINYTYKTLEYFNALYKGDQLFFITGADCLMDLEEWQNIDSIFKLCNFVVFNRPSDSKQNILNQKLYVEKKYNVNITFLDIPVMDISSTYIREQRKLNRNISRFLPKAVENIILKNNLYK